MNRAIALASGDAVAADDTTVRATARGKPRLTVGVPAWNNGQTIARALESLLAQDLGDLRILVSDDGSRDDTAAICAAIAGRDPRLRVVRQPRNLRYGNFGWLLEQADTEYFMWAAGDDRWLAGHAAACVAELDAHPGLVAAVPRVAFEHEGVALGLAQGTGALLGEPAANLARFLADPADNSRMYGVFRTAAAQRSFPRIGFHAWDWGYSAATLRFGGHAEIPEVLMVRDKTPTERYVAMVREDAHGFVDRVLPVLAMSRWLLGQPGVPRTTPVLQALLALNLEKHLQYARRFHPTWAAVAWRLINPLMNRSRAAARSTTDRRLEPR
jgi:glycosyltransferase involved in cell wall biosynthesis